MSQTVFFLKPVPPFHLDLTAWALRRRPDNLVDRWDGQTYRRVIPLADGPVEVAVRQIRSPETPVLRVTAVGRAHGFSVKSAVTSALERLLGIRSDLAGFYRFASRQTKLWPLVRRFRGMKPPRFPSLFETLINGIACQQITLTLGIRLLNLLAGHYGAALRTEEGCVHAFPRPEDLAGRDPAALRPLGFSRQKALGMIELARAISLGHLDLEGLAVLPDEEALTRLRELRGVGRWTAEYVLLRGLGRLHVFPGDDAGARNSLQRWLELTDTLDYDGVSRTLARWKPYGGLIYLHLLLDGLASAGHLS